MKKIGILTRTLTSNTNVNLNAIPFAYLNTFNKNFFPIIIDSSITLSTHKEELLKTIKDVNGFIIPGGNDINEIDLFIIDYCYKNDMPLLAICLGMQELGYYFDKSSIQPLNSLEHFNIDAPYMHAIKINKKGYLFSLLNKETIPVNSRHKYHLLKNKNYTIEATSSNIIEAIKIKNKKYIVGYQFHPETMYYYDDNAKLLINDFLNNCN